MLSDMSQTDIILMKAISEGLAADTEVISRAYKYSVGTQVAWMEAIIDPENPYSDDDHIIVRNMDEDCFYDEDSRKPAEKIPADVLSILKDMAKKEVQKEYAEQQREGKPIENKDYSLDSNIQKEDDEIERD